MLQHSITRTVLINAFVRLLIRESEDDCNLFFNIICF